MFYTIHFFLGAIGLVGLLNTALLLWGMEIPNYSVDYGTYKYIALNKEKILDLLLHVVGVFLLVVYFATVRQYFRREISRDCDKCWQQRGWLVMVAAFTIAVLNWRPEKPYEISDWAVFAGLLILWGIITYAPFYSVRAQKFCQKIDWNAQWDPTNTGRIYILLTVVALGQLIWTLAPFALQRVQLLNEYLDMPTTTLLFESKQEVPDSSYYDAHQLLGPALRYLPDRDRGKTPQIADTVCTLVKPFPGMASFLVEENNRNSYVYDETHNKLCAVDVVSTRQWLQLREMTPDEAGKKQLDGWYVSVSEYAQNLQEKVMKREEQQFFRVNQFVLRFQFGGNGVLHHHGFMLNPLNEYDLGKPRSEIFAQYGWLNLWLTRSLMKLFGGIDFQTYFKVWYSYYYVYYVLYFWLLWLVFRHRGYLAAGALLSVGLLCLIGFQWLLQPPGINPIRRIMEVPLIACMFLYWKNQRRLYLCLAIGSLWLAILNNWQFGLMALVASGLVLAISQMGRDERRKADIIIMMFGLAVCLALITWLKGGTDPLSRYYLAGASAIPIEAWLGVGVLVVFSVGTVLLLRSFDRSNPMSYLCGFLLLYTAEVMTYSLWNGSHTYMLVPGPLYVLLLLTFTCHSIEQFRQLRNYGNALTGILVCISLCVFIAGSWHQDKTHNEFLGLMESHKTYEWNMDRAQFTSTMDPHYFENGVGLIKKYSTEPNIYIVSKYDAFLPFLAGRYSAMPYFEVSKFLTSPHETEACLQRLIADKPDILFVDTDIHRNFATDIVHQHAPLGRFNAISRFHVEQMRTLQKVFLAVQDDYELVEQGLLISVYKRK